MNQIKEELAGWNESFLKESMPMDAVDFSFWVIGILPLDDLMKLHLVKMDNAIQRMRCQLSILKRVCSFFSGFDSLKKNSISLVCHDVKR